MLASYTAGVYRNAGGQECRVMRFSGGKDLRAYDAVVASVAGAQRWWLYGR